MGLWGTGLYSGDFAMDLRTTIGAVARLPFDSDRLLEILCESEPTAANKPNDEEHTTFWLIVADQFAKRGIVCDVVRQRALRIIDDFQDLAMLEKLGMKTSDICHRRELLLAVRERIALPPLSRSRTVLRKPQSLLMDIGDVIVYPTCEGKCINPYFPSKVMNKRYTKTGSLPWVQNGWAAAVIVDCGRAFDFLSWYRPLTVAVARSEKPTLDSLQGNILWRLELPGTCSPIHFKKMELEKVGRLPLDPEKVKKPFPGLRPGISAAVRNISISNRLSALSLAGYLVIPKSGESLRGRSPILQGIEQLLEDYS
jgi:hypothetical protein